jgi:hypothetical protein
MSELATLEHPPSSELAPSRMLCADCKASQAGTGSDVLRLAPDGAKEGGSMGRLLTFAAVVALALAALIGTAQAQVQDDLVAGRTFVIPLSGPGGSGTSVFTLNPGLGLVCYTIDVTLTTAGDVPAEPAPGLGTAHIHVRPSGGIFIDLEAQFQATDGGFTASDCVTADREAIIAIFANPERYYVNVHTVAFPGGAVSGDFG